MFGFFNHPKPVNLSRPVAEFSARQTINAQSKSILLISENNRVPPAELLPSTGKISTPITFIVRYKYTEWLAFVRAHIRTVLIVQGRLRQRQKSPKYIYLFTPLALMIFLYKKHKMPQCTFSIDQDGVTRNVRGKAKAYSWNEFTAVYSYVPGILLALKDGAMPIPRRCFSASQWLQLKMLIHAHLPQA